MRSLWEDEETGGMLYKEMEGDFIVESKINSLKILMVIICPTGVFSREVLLSGV